MIDNAAAKRSVCSRIAVLLDAKNPLRGDLLHLLPRLKSKKRAA